NVPVSQVRQQLHRNGWLPVNGIFGNGIQTGIENHGVIYASTMGRGIFRCETFRGPVSVPENIYTENSSSLQIYPNPAIDNINIQFDLTQNSNAEISILNLNGQTINTKKLNKLNKGTQNIEMPVSNLSSGIYMISVKTTDGKYLGKLIKK
ncbi:MAG: T9SS type A sorting domain-containing protein, partial [Bacteroidales bacterium]|nr:T9SS type A sorting domain-containing protein [Bacteroidales bacterium]